MKYLRKFDSHEAFTSKYTEIKDQEYCVSAVQDMCGKKDTEEPEVRVYFKDSNFNAWAGDLLCWDTAAKKWVIQNVEHNVDTALTLPSNLVPDAVCVVPACHTEDGKARWCALNDAKNDALKAGTNGDKHYFRWGATDAQWSTLIEELSLYTAVPKMQYQITDDNNFYYINEAVRTTTTLNKLAWYCPDKYINELMPFDNYSNDFSDFTQIQGYPNEVRVTMHGTGRDPFDDYDGEGSFNSVGVYPYIPDENGNLFGKNTKAFTPLIGEDGNNTFCDLSGFENTQILLKHSPNGTEYPAALAASLYEQTYSPAGTWYLPAAGELAYYWAMWYPIQHTFYRLQQGSYSASPLYCNDYYWSSSQYSADYAVVLDTAAGDLGSDGKVYYSSLVRPFRSF